MEELASTVLFGLAEFLRWVGWRVHGLSWSIHRLSDRLAHLSVEVLGVAAPPH